MRRLAAACVAAVALATAARAGDRRGTGSASFRHGARTYRLPLETIDLEELRAAGRTEVHASLVFRDARNRLLALAFVHRGPGPVPAPRSIELTASTPSGLSRVAPGRTRCEIQVARAGPTFVEGTARCRDLTDFGGERRAPDVSDVRFTARASPGPAPPAANAGTRNPGLSGEAQVGLPAVTDCPGAPGAPRWVSPNR